MNTISIRTLAGLAAAGFATFATTKWLAPLGAQFLGARRGAAALDLLAAEHKMLLAVLDEMVATPGTDPAKRTRLFAQAKTALTAHALAEEDVVYPLIADVAHDDAKMRELFEEHGEMKHLLGGLERLPKSEPAWHVLAIQLRELVADHANDEETYAFPALRAALSEKDAAFLGGGVAREQALLLS